jgi:hypothetical protein
MTFLKFKDSKLQTQVFCLQVPGFPIPLGPPVCTLGFPMVPSFSLDMGTSAFSLSQLACVYVQASYSG